MFQGHKTKPFTFIVMWLHVVTTHTYLVLKSDWSNMWKEHFLKINCHKNVGHIFHWLKRDLKQHN